jgi:hypothetical protein
MISLEADLFPVHFLIFYCSRSVITQIRSIRRLQSTPDIPHSSCTSKLLRTIVLASTSPQKVTEKTPPAYFSAYLSNLLNNNGAALSTQ